MSAVAEARLHVARRAFDRRAAQVLAPLLNGELPLGAALAFDLEALRVPSGRWADLVRAAPGRLLDLPLLALHDLDHPMGAARDAAEAGLLDAGALSVAAIFLSEAMAGAEAAYEPASALLLGPLVASATARLVEGAADPAGTGARFAAAWASHAESMEQVGLRRPEWTTAGDALAPEVLANLGRRHAPHVALFSHALEVGGRPELVPALTPVIETVAGLHQLSCDLDTLHRDLARGFWTLPVARLAAAVGALPPGDAPPPASPVRVSLLLTGAVPALARVALANVQAAIAHLAEAGLDAVASAVGHLAVAWQAVLDRYGPARPAPPATAAPVAFRVDPRPRRAQALDALRAALDDDPESREAWGVCRAGHPGETPETDRLARPVDILACRVRAGERRPAEVDAQVRALAQASGRLEVDTLAALAGLAPDAGDPATAYRTLQPLLSQALARRTPKGDVPPWVDPTSGAGAHGPPCAAVQARLARAMLRWPEPHAETHGLAFRALERIAAEGAGAIAVHDPLHGALLALELTEACAATGELAGEAAAGARRWALAFAERWCGRAARSPLAAAWLWLITAHPDARHLRDPRWRERILRAQRAAGTWDAEPACRRDRPASRLVTTAHVYPALVDADNVG